MNSIRSQRSPTWRLGDDTRPAGAAVLDLGNGARPRSAGIGRGQHAPVAGSCAVHRRLAGRALSTAGSATPGDVAALLATRPSRWLKPFLLVAVRSATGVSLPSPVWFRLGRLEESAGAVGAPLIWWPHAGDRVFPRFQGILGVTRTDGRTALFLEGATHGGHHTTNLATLQALLGLLSDALGSGYGVPS